MRFDRVIVADWSAANRPTSPTRRENAIWLGSRDGAGGQETHHATRHAAEADLAARISDARATGARLLIGFDFAFGYPQGFAARLTGQPAAAAVWGWLARHITDTPANANNRFDVASRANDAFPEGPGPFWSHPPGQSWPGLPARRAGIDYAALGLAEGRLAERAARGAKSPFMLFNPGAVGSQSLLGLPMIHRLSQLPGVAVWPFTDTPDAPVILAEVYPSLLGPAVAEAARHDGLVTDQAQVRLLALALWRLGQSGGLAPLWSCPAIAAEEGWVLGANDPGLLRGALAW